MNLQLLKRKKWNSWRSRKLKDNRGKGLGGILKALFPLSKESDLSWIGAFRIVKKTPSATARSVAPHVSCVTCRSRSDAAAGLWWATWRQFATFRACRNFHINSQANSKNVRTLPKLCLEEIVKCAPCEVEEFIV